MPAQESGDGLDQLAVGLAVLEGAGGAGKKNTPQYIPLGEDRGGAGYQIGVVPLANGDVLQSEFPRFGK